MLPLLYKLTDKSSSKLLDDLSIDKVYNFKKKIKNSFETKLINGILSTFIFESIEIRYFQDTNESVVLERYKIYFSEGRINTNELNQFGIGELSQLEFMKFEDIVNIQSSTRVLIKRKYYP